MAAKSAALGDVHIMANEAARQLVARLIGVEPASADIASAIAAAEREQR